MAIFPGEVRSVPRSIVSKTIENPLPEVFDRNNKLLVTSVKTKRASIRNPINPEETARLIKAVLPAWDENRLIENLKKKTRVEWVKKIKRGFANLGCS